MKDSLTTLCTTFTVTCHVRDKGLDDSSAVAFALADIGYRSCIQP